MKKNDTITVIKSGVKAIRAELVKLSSEAANLKLQRSRGEVKNSRRAKIIRRTIARLSTALSVQGAI